MEKEINENNNYFIGENGIYMEMQNIKVYKDNDGIKRFIIELKDSKKISSIKKLISKKEKTEIEIVFDEKENKIDFPDLKDL